MTLLLHTAILIAILALAFVLSCASVSVNDRPIIGILTQDTRSTGNLKFQKLGRTYIPASYVKWIESAGGRVVPIPYDADKSTLKHLFQSINGLLLPGFASTFLSFLFY